MRKLILPFLILLVSVSVYSQDPIFSAEYKTNKCIDEFLKSNNYSLKKLQRHFENFLSNHKHVLELDSNKNYSYKKYLKFRRDKESIRISDYSDLKVALINAGIIEPNFPVCKVFMKCYLQNYYKYNSLIDTSSTFFKVGKGICNYINGDSVDVNAFAGYLVNTLSDEDYSNNLYQKTILFLTFVDVVYIMDMYSKRSDKNNPYHNMQDNFIGTIEIKDEPLIINREIVSPNEKKMQFQDEIFHVVEEMPEFPGGEEKLKNFLAKKLNYPVTGGCDLQGTVYVQIVITKNGKVVNPEIVRGIDPYYDKEALRVVKSLPDWKPGKQNGKPVNVYYLLPVEFKLN